MDLDEELTDRQKDELQELGNVGAGRASRYLSEQVDHRVDIGIPDVQKVDMEAEDVSNQIFNLESSSDATAVLIPFQDAEGKIVFVFKQENYQNFLRLWRNDEEGEEHNENFLEVSRKVGEIYIEALDQLIDLDLEAGEPRLVSLDVSALTIHTTSNINSSCGPNKNCILAINTTMEIGDSESVITMLLNHEQVERILEAMEEQL